MLAIIRNPECRGWCVWDVEKDRRVKSGAEVEIVQPNTFLKEDGTVELREYEASNEGIIHSFFERLV
jgi:hypothetical protein